MFGKKTNKNFSDDFRARSRKRFNFLRMQNNAEKYPDTAKHVTKNSSNEKKSQNK